MILVDPRGLTVGDWCDSMAIPLSQLMSTPILNNEEWKEWALMIVQNPIIASQAPPNPNQFEDWMEWAIRFNQSISSL